MPKKQNGRSQEQAQYQYKGHIDCDLDASDIEPFRQYYADPEGVLGEISTLISSGYTIKVGYDQINQCFAASITGTYDLAPADFGWHLVGRGSNAYRALAQAAYKHYHLLHGDWSELRRAMHLGSWNFE